MRLMTITTFLAAYASLAMGQTFSAFLSRVNSVPNAERPAIVDSFMTAVPGFPYIEETMQVHFLYRGPASSAQVPGDMNGWTPSAANMTQISGTDLWYYSRFFEADARLDYKYVLNGSNWILDPRNPYTVTGGFGPNSELRMPEFVQPPEIENYPEVAQGVIRDTMFTSSVMGNTRRVRIYTPPGYENSGQSYPLLLVHDGLEFITLARCERVLNYLIHHNQIRPLIAVFVPPVDRTPEYAGDRQDEFGQFITTELLPFVDSAYRTDSDPQNRGTMGSSNGGNIALWLGVTFPETFGQVIAFSSNVEQNITAVLEQNDDLPLRFYLDIGTYDIPVLIPRVQGLVQILENQEYPYFYQEIHDGHSWGNWRGHIDDALRFTFPSTTEAPERVVLPVSFKLAQNYPNPFNPTTTIELALQERMYVSLDVFDTTGRLVESLANGMYDIGNHEFVFNGTQLPTGSYLARVVANGRVSAIRMILVK